MLGGGVRLGLLPGLALCLLTVAGPAHDTSQGLAATDDTSEPGGDASANGGRVGMSWGGDETRSVLKLRRAGVRAVTVGRSGPSAGPALDAAGCGDAVAVLVGQGRAGG
jgi:hypothetical protein